MRSGRRQRITRVLPRLLPLSAILTHLLSFLSFPFSLHTSVITPSGLSAPTFICDLQCVLLPDHFTVSLFLFPFSLPPCPLFYVVQHLCPFCVLDLTSIWGDSFLVTFHSFLFLFSPL